MEEKDPSDEYVKAFNRGYILRKYKPDLHIEQATGTSKDTDAVQGFNDGVKQYDKEQLEDVSKELRRETMRERYLGPKENKPREKDKDR